MRKHHPALHSSPGFTFIELLVSATIIIILTTIAAVAFRSAGVNARDAKRKADLEAVRQALVLYKTENVTYPVMTAGYPTSKTQFTTVVTTLQNGNYLSTGVIQDPNGTAGDFGYRYWSDGATFRLSAEIESDGIQPGEVGDYVVTNPP